MLSCLTNRIRIATCLCIFSGIPFNTALADNFRVSGFIGIGAISTSDNNFLGTDTNRRTLVDAGLQASYAINDNIGLTGQVTYRRLGELTTDAGPRIDLASIDFYSQLIGETQISLGRVKPSNGLYNETRDLPMSRPTILMPQSIYSEFFRDFLLSFDGIRISTAVPFEWGALSFEAAIGYANINENFNEALLGSLSLGEWETGLNQSIEFGLETDKWTVLVSNFKGDSDYTAYANSRLITVIPDFFVPLISGNLAVDSYIASVQYRIGNSELSAEYINRTNDFSGILELQTSTSEGWYGQIRHSFTSALSATLRHEVYFRNVDGRNGVASGPFKSPAHANQSRTTMFAISWQIDNSLQASAEIHFFEGAGFLAPLTTPSVDAFGKKHWSMFSTQVTYRF